MATFKLVPYRFKIHVKGNKSKIISFDDVDKKGTDFYDFVHDKLSNDTKEYIFKDNKKTISCDYANKSNRTVSGIVKYGEYGIEGSFTDVNTGNELQMKRKTNHSEKYPFFFYMYIPAKSNQGIIILQTFKTFGIKSAFSRMLSKYLESFGYRLDMNHMISRNLLDKLENSRLVELDLIKYSTPSDVSEKITENPSKEFYDVRSIIAHRNKELKIVDWLKEKLSETDVSYYEIENERYDEIKAVVETDKLKKTLTFGEKMKCRENVPLEGEIPLNGSFPKYEYLMYRSNIYLEDIMENIGVEEN